MNKIRILIIEDNRLLREGISVLLKKQPDMIVVNTVGNGENILDLIAKLKPDILLLDLSLRNQNSMQVVKLVKSNFEETKIIMMDLIPIQEDVFDFVKAGVSGFMLKDISVSEFLKTIRAVFNGSQVLPPHLTGSLFSQIVEHAFNGSAKSLIDNSVRITGREQQIIKLIADGSSNKAIAQKLHISLYTAKSHVHNILEKLALNTRLQIAQHAHLSEEFGTKITTDSFLKE